MPRPLSVVLAAILILWWGLRDALLIVLTMVLAGTHGALPAFAASGAVPLALLSLDAAIDLVSGINILRGRNWARLLYSVFTVLHILGSVLFSAEKNLMLTILFLQFVVILVLFLPKSNAYFEGA